MKRNTNLDVLRILAMLLVLVQHTWLNFTVREDFFPSKLFFILEFPVIISKTAVLLFFMISGYLILPKSYTVLVNLTRTWKRLIVPYLFFELLNVINHRFFMSYSQLSWLEYLQFEIERLYSYPSSPLWFLIFLIYFYLLNPILQPFFKPSHKQTAQYLTLAAFLFTVFASTHSFFANSVASIYTSYTGWTGYIFFYLFGGLVALNGHPDWLQKRSLLLAALSFVVIYLGDTFHMMQVVRGAATQWTGYTNSTFSLTVIMLALSIFVLILHRQSQLTFGLTKRTIAYWASYTYGVYLIHPLIVAALTNNLGFTFDHLHLNVYLYNLVNFAIVLLSSLLLTYLLKNAGLLRKFIGE